MPSDEVRSGRRPVRSRTSPVADDAAAIAAHPTPLRIGVDRGMVAAVALAGPLLVLQSLPTFAAERVPASPLALLSLVLAGALALGSPLALLRRGQPAVGWVLLSATAFMLLVALEPFEIVSPMPTAYTPWLIGLSCVGFSCLTVGLVRPLHAALGSAVMVGGVIAVYAGRVSPIHLAIDAVGLASLAAGLIAGVRALRRRADRADDAQRAAHELFDGTRRLVALEDERIRTDALLHDSVLTTLLVAAGGGDAPHRTVLMARNALNIVSTTQAGPTGASSVTTLEQALVTCESELAPMRGLVRLDLVAAHDVVLPSRVAEALVAATLQAMSNSIKHAGLSADIVATAVPVEPHGVRISVRDDGQGFDLSGIAAERLGVRVSILERMRLIGGFAEIRSQPSTGTEVVLEWWPASAVPAADLRAAVRA